MFQSLNLVKPIEPQRIATRTRQTGSVRRIQALKHQAAMLAADKKFMLLVAGYGSGKSHALHLCVVTDAVRYPKIKLLVLAPSYDLLRLNNVPAILEMLSDWNIKYNFNKSEYIIYLSNGSQIIFRSLDNPSRIVAFEVCRSYIDEADVPPLTAMEMGWNKTLARTRQVILHDGKIVSNRVWAFSTPEGFKFCYKRWVKQGGADYGMVRARTADNPFLPADFIQSLRDTYPEQLIEAYLNGEFVNLTSGTVYYSFDRNVQYSIETAKVSDILYIGMDFNVGKQAAVIYVKRGKAFHAVYEFTGVLDTPKMMELIDARFPKNPKVFYPDATGNSRNTTNAGVSDHAILKDHGKVKVRPANPFVKDRVAAVNAAFEHDLLFVNVEECPEFTEALEQQIYDVNNRPDKATATGHDHINDAGGYPIAYEMPIANRKSYLKVVQL